MRMRTTTTLVSLITLLAVIAGVRAEVPKRAAGPALIYTSTAHYDGLAWLNGGERFPAGATLMVRSGGTTRALAEGWASTADASISFDGTKVLFAGKKAVTDRWQIWEATIAGGEATQLTRCDDDCVKPFYLPERRIAYARKIDGVFQIEAAAMGGGTLRLTYAPSDAMPTDVLRDGRILFEAAFPLGEGKQAELYTVYSDGSGVESYRCDHGTSRYAGQQAASGDVMFAHEAGMGRFTSALAHEAGVVAPVGEYAGEMVEASEGRWIVPWRSDSAKHFSLQEWSTTTRGLRLIAADAKTDLVEPRIVKAREVPNRHPSGLHDWDGANVLCLNAYTSKLKIAPGSVDSVQVYALRDGRTELLGQARVEEDGSFFLHVPADRPLQMELLDKAGKTVQREHGWFWMRRGEQRVCVGCHAGPERAPENAVPQVVVKSTEPADMTRQAPLSKGGR